MKHKIVIALFLSLFAATYSLHAQSSSVAKAKADLQQRKQHGNDLLAKAHQQQEQAKHEVAPSNASSFQQQSKPNDPKQRGQEQPMLNNTNKREHVNH